MDPNNNLEVEIKSIGESIDKTMNGIFIGQIAINAVVGASMNKMLQAIKVIQLLSFILLIEIDYTPITQIYLESIYKFATFKMIPPEFMQWFTGLLSPEE